MRYGVTLRVTLRNGLLRGIVCFRQLPVIVMVLPPAPRPDRPRRHTQSVTRNVLRDVTRNAYLDRADGKHNGGPGNAVREHLLYHVRNRGSANLHLSIHVLRHLTADDLPPVRDHLRDLVGRCCSRHLAVRDALAPRLLRYFDERAERPDLRWLCHFAPLKIPHASKTPSARSKPWATTE